MQVEHCWTLTVTLTQNSNQAGFPCQYKHDVPVSSDLLTASSTSRLQQQTERECERNQYVIRGCKTTPAQCSWDDENNLQDGLNSVLGQNEFVATCNTACLFCTTVVLEASRIGQYNNMYYETINIRQQFCHTINTEVSTPLMSLVVLHHCGKCCESKSRTASWWY